MKRVIKKIITGTALLTVLTFAITVIIILNPQILFAEKVSYKNINIYSDSVIEDNYKPSLDFALKLAEQSEIYLANQQFDIFLCNGTIYKALDTKILGPAMARSIHNNILLRVELDFDKNILIGPNSNRNLKKTIAHEMMHYFQMKKYGMSKFNPVNHPPMWKLEGYPEYVACQDDIRSKNYKLCESIKKLMEFQKTGEYWLETEPGQFDPLIYFKGRVMIEFLMDIKKLTYTEILGDSIIEATVVSQMTDWYHNKNDEE